MPPCMHHVRPCGAPGSTDLLQRVRFEAPARRPFACTFLDLITGWTGPTGHGTPWPLTPVQATGMSAASNDTASRFLRAYTTLAFATVHRMHGVLRPVLGCGMSGGKAVDGGASLQ